MKCVVAEAPGKVILFGEHFVVEGVPAIAASIELMARVKAEEWTGRAVVVESDRYGAGEVWPRCSVPRLCYISRIVVRASQLLGYTEPWPARLRIDSEIPPGGGLGSSAAVSIALAAAYMRLRGEEIGKDLVYQAGFVGEEVIHGKPSGIDTRIALEGGAIYYRRGEEPRKLDMEGFRALLVIASSGVERSTGEAVRLVLSRKRELGELGDEIYRVAGLLVERAVRALSERNYRLIGALMDVNHGLLNALGVSLPVLEELVYTARRAGALGAKITGAGLGGSIIALALPGEAGKVERALQGKARSVFTVRVGGEGLRLYSCR